MTNAKIDLMAPEWQMEDAYGDIRSPRYEASVAEALEAVRNLETDTAVTRENVAAKLALYDRAVTLLSSLASFVKCTGAKDGTDERVPAENARLADISARRDRAANTLFAFLEALPSEDPLWKTSPLSDWAFVVSERRSDWKKSLTEPNATGSPRGRRAALRRSATSSRPCSRASTLKRRTLRAKRNASAPPSSFP